MKRKICNRGLNRIQIIDYKGTVRICGWMRDQNIGSLSCSNLKDIYHSQHANELRERMFNGDYSLCDIDACPYLAMDDLGNHSIEIEEIPEYPEELYLGYENICNYHCKSCTIHDIMMKNKLEDLEKGYDKIEEQIKDILPHLKVISANGMGELFCSKRILKLLSEWKPIAPAEEITVMLESNGSLFDEFHWKQIENLGQYNLIVSITIMSFDETIYQCLSGTNLPIKQLEDNLRFIKSLREKGIINYLELATVVQDRNFRTMPEFTRRCLEEFAADSVRLRPYEPWGSQEPEIEWFMDVRNPAHPYYAEYKKIMEDKVFKHPKVKDWSGGKDTVNQRPFPYRSYKWSNLVERSLVNIILNFDIATEAVKSHIKDEYPLVIYGFGNMGKILLKMWIEKGIIPAYVLDKNSHHDIFEGIQIYNLKEANVLEKKVVVLITPLRDIENIKIDLKKLGYQGEIILIKDLLNDKDLVEEISCNLV